MMRISASAVAAWVALPLASHASVLHVCSGTTTGFDCGGAYATIQSAVDDAVPGDWILVAPGIYHEKAGEAGVMITKPGIHRAGLDRNRVIVDGTNAGPDDPCSSNPASQDFSGRNGIEVFGGADGVSIENLTVCNYLSGDGGDGNQVWWNGGDGTGEIHLGPYHGGYLTATSTYFQDADSHQGSYGVFVSNSRGPGDIVHSYANNMSDSAFYVGACPDCNTVLDHVHGENCPLGYSGTNSGGHLLIQNSEFDRNKSGIVPNSLNNDDAPPPQDGRGPGWKEGER